jgi:hypothetical protein
MSIPSVARFGSPFFSFTLDFDCIFFISLRFFSAFRRDVLPT